MSAIAWPFFVPLMPDVSGKRLLLIIMASIGIVQRATDVGVTGILGVYVTFLYLGSYSPIER